MLAWQQREPAKVQHRQRDDPHDPQYVHGSADRPAASRLVPLVRVARAHLRDRETDDRQPRDRVQVVLARAATAVGRLDEVDERAERALREVQHEDRKAEFLSGVSVIRESARRGTYHVEVAEVRAIPYGSN